MITEHDLDEAIAECLGKRNPDSGTCIKLAAYYTIRDHLFGGESSADSEIKNTTMLAYSGGYSRDDAPVVLSSRSEFSEVVNGMNPAQVWPVMDELMDTIKALQPRLYEGVMRKLQE